MCVPLPRLFKSLFFQVFLLFGAGASFGQDLALNKTTTASSQESPSYAASLAVDGNASTRWSSARRDTEWIQIDLGSSYSITFVTLAWEAASAKSYTIDVSNDTATWVTLATRTNMAVGARTDNLTGLSGSGRYIRMKGISRNSTYGYSLFAFSVFGSKGVDLPGRLQAEDYKAGGEGVGYHDLTAGNTGGAYRNDGVDIGVTTDVGGGFNVGWIQPGEWLAFDANVTRAGRYTFAARVASGNIGAKSLDLSIDGVSVGSIPFTTAAGWQAWTDAVLENVSLSAGSHVLRVTMATGVFNLNYVQVIDASLPVANAGADRSIVLGATVTLDASKSKDPVIGPLPLSYNWRQISGPSVSLTGATSATPTFVPQEQGAYTFEVSVSDGATASADQVTITTLFKPSAPGAFNSERIVYAAPGLDYGALAVAPILIPASNYEGDRYTNVTYSDYQRFSSPQYQTRTYDMSVFNYYGQDTFPCLNADGSNIPLNGIFYKPVGDGPFPIVFFVHGNHHPKERSELGYEALCAMLASQGMIGVAVDENYMNAGGGNGARALLLLEHIKQFQTWNQTAGHPLHSKIDMNNILIVGHSRGGEAVSLASYFNRMTKQGVTQLRNRIYVENEPRPSEPVNIDGSGQFGPYRFAIKAVAAIAPTSGQYDLLDPNDGTKTIDPVIDIPYFLISSGRDSDVGNTAGLDTYDSANRFEPTSSIDVVSGVKGHLFLHNANHNFFNTVWSAAPDGIGRCMYQICHSTSLQLSAADQQESLRCFVGAVSQSMLRGISGYLTLFKDKALCATTLPQNAVSESGDSLPIAFNNQFQDNCRLLLNHFEEDAALNTASHLPGGILGTNSVTPGLTTAELLLSNTPVGNFKENVLSATWSSGGQAYSTVFTSTLPIQASTGETFTTLALRVGFRCSDVENNPAVNQDFSLQIKDSLGRQYRVAASAISGGIPPLPKQTYVAPHEYYGCPDGGDCILYPLILQTVRFPLSSFAANGVNTAAISEVSLVFDKTVKGKVFIDDIQLTK